MAANIEAIAANQLQTIEHMHVARAEELVVQAAAHIAFMAQQDEMKNEILEL